MTEWEEIQPVFRQKVLRRGEKTLQDVADECLIGRKTLERLMKNETRPIRAVVDQVERYVSEGHVTQPDSDGTDD